MRKEFKQHHAQLDRMLRKRHMMNATELAGRTIVDAGTERDDEGSTSLTSRATKDDGAVENQESSRGDKTADKKEDDEADDGDDESDGKKQRKEKRAAKGSRRSKKGKHKHKHAHKSADA